MSEKPLMSEGADPSTIVIADDHPLFRSALRQILHDDRAAGLEVVGEAANGREAVALCRRLRPQLVLMDLRMPDLDGLAATRAIKRDLPNTIVLVLTALEDPNYLAEALKAGATGYLLKDATRPEIINAVRKALDGRSPVNPEFAVRLLRQLLLAEKPKRQPPADASPEGSVSKHAHAPPIEGLSRGEAAVLRLVAMGQTNQEIAQSLLISMSTAKKHVRSIICKLEVSDRTQAAIKAHQLGLLADREQ